MKRFFNGLPPLSAFDSVCQRDCPPPKGVYLVGNVMTVTDPNGHTTVYGYDKANRRTSVTHADGNMRLFSYDGVGNMTWQKDEAKTETRWTYDSAGRLLKTEYMGGALYTPPVTYEYDKAGNRTKAKGSVTAASGSLDYVTSWTYDELNRAKTETISVDGTARVEKMYKRDVVGNVTRLEVGTSNTEFVTGWAYGDHEIISDS